MKKSKKQDLKKLFKEAKEEYNDEKWDRAKEEIKSKLHEYDMAKATVKKLETQMKKILKSNNMDVEFLLDYEK